MESIDIVVLVSRDIRGLELNRGFVDAALQHHSVDSKVFVNRRIGSRVRRSEFAARLSVTALL